jgi:hypothetical protein
MPLEFPELQCGVLHASAIAASLAVLGRASALACEACSALLRPPSGISWLVAKPDLASDERNAGLAAGRISGAAARAPITPGAASAFGTRGAIEELPGSAVLRSTGAALRAPASIAWGTGGRMADFVAGSGTDPDTNASRRGVAPASVSVPSYAECNLFGSACKESADSGPSGCAGCSRAAPLRAGVCGRISDRSAKDGPSYGVGAVVGVDVRAACGREGARSAGCAKFSAASLTGKDCAPFSACGGVGACGSRRSATRLSGASMRAEPR